MPPKSLDQKRTPADATDPDWLYGPRAVTTALSPGEKNRGSLDAPLKTGSVLQRGALVPKASQSADYKTMHQASADTLLHPARWEGSMQSHIDKSESR